MMKQLILSTLLHYANRNVLHIYRNEFYEIKDNLLKKYGKYILNELQHIKKKCYNCDGTGIFKCNWKPNEMCWSCGGSGIYSEFWVLLKKYNFGSYYFHIPVTKYYNEKYLPEKIKEQNIIEGLIRKELPKYNLGLECMLILFLIYDLTTFKKVINFNYYRNGAITPLVFFGNILFLGKKFKKISKNKIISLKGNRNNNIILYTDEEELPF